jgi:alkylation response protein AidB-like acyl-CoA dehydrogenase
LQPTKGAVTVAISLTAEQEQLAAAVSRFAARHAPTGTTRAEFESLAAGAVPSWWRDLVAHGFHAVHLPEDIGGQGGRLADAACVVESAGRALLPGPLLSTVTAGAVVLHSRTTAASTALLRDLADGATAAIVLPGRADFRATAAGDGWRVSGTSGVTLGVLAARQLVLAARTDQGGYLWFVVSGSDVTVESRPGTDRTTDVGIVRLDGVLVSKPMVLGGIDPRRAECVAVSMAACATAGAISWAVEAVSAHLGTRAQFGKLIGTFQALQHRAAMLLVNSELATSAAWDAVRAVDEPIEQHQLAAAGAAIMSVAPAPELLLDSLTMFGAIGYTWEHDLHLYWRRAISLAAATGPAAGWARQLGELSATATRDTSLDLGDREADLRARVSETLDHAMSLRNDGPGRQGDYEHFATGAQRTLIADAGLVAPHWPPPWGLDAKPLQQLVIDEEFAKRPQLVRPSLGIAEWILPSLLSAAPRGIQDRFIPPTQRGELAWCQLFSEPGAGSDLAALSTRATKVDGGWRINGHKIWTSAAHVADFGALLARTDPNAAKHKGIGYFILDMHAPGVEVQPIRQATGEANFNEVFLTDVFIPDTMLLGAATGGWDLAIATMAQERVAIGGYVNIDRAGPLRALAERRNDPPAAEHGDVLRALGEIDAYTNAIKALGVRETLRLLEGRAAGPASSIAKVATNVMLRKAFEAVLALTGPLAMTEDSEPAVARPYLLLPAELLGGGTNEIQLNIIAQMIMGLPRK